MLLLALQLTLGQLLPAPPPVDQDPARTWEPPPEPAPSNAAPQDAVTPEKEETPLDPGAPPPVPPRRPGRPEGPTRLMRGAAGIGGGLVGGIAALGITAAMAASNGGLDYTYTNAGLGAIMIAGVSFTVNHALGGHGEVIFALLGSLAMMAGALAAAFAIDPGGTDVSWLTTAIGALPASIASVLLLEASTPENRAAYSMNVGPGSLLVRF